MSHYYTLMTSLPRHTRSFKVQETTISRIQLDKHLKLLPEAEKIRLDNVVNLVWDSWFKFTTPLNATIQQSDPLLALNDPFITDLITWFFDLRSILVALRLRNMQAPKPKNTQQYWQTQWDRFLTKYWDKPDFNLGRVYPWILEVNTKLANNETDEVEDILLTLIWKHLEIIETGHYFDFAALVLYLLRWKIVDYWSKFNETSSAEYMQKLCDDIMSKDMHHE